MTTAKAFALALSLLTATFIVGRWTEVVTATMY